MLKVLFITNILSRHQVGLWDEFAELDGVSFTYLCTNDAFSGRDVDRYQTSGREYVQFSSDYDADSVKKLISEQSFLVVGSVEDERLLNVVKSHKNVFIATEHLFKLNREFASPFRWFLARLSFLLSSRRFAKRFGIKGRRLLCMSAHVAAEYALLGVRRSRMYRFGYFPPLEYSNQESLSCKDTSQILFVGRDASFKHPRDAVEFCRYLRTKNASYHLTVYGEGLEKYIPKEKGFNYLGVVENDAVLAAMRGAGIFIFPSDSGEGWGTVLGEAMASGCIVFANVEAGSTNYLVNGANGFKYSSKRQLKHAIASFLSMNEDDVMRMRHSAVRTMEQLWNGKVAARRLFDVMLSIKNDKQPPRYSKGPMKRA